MVTGADVPQGVRMVPRFTLEVCDGMTIAQAMANADALGGNWTILVYPGIYDEGDLTPTGGANITIKGMGEGAVIAPAVAPAIAVINVSNPLNLEDIAVISPDATRPAVLVNLAAGDFNATKSTIVGVAPGYGLQMVRGSANIIHSTLSADTHLSTARCLLDCYFATFLGDLITAAEALNHDIDLMSCEMTNGSITSNATGATVLACEGVSDIDVVTNAGTGLFTLDDCSIAAVNCTNAAGEIRVIGGVLLAITRAVGTVVWWQDSNTLKVIPSATTTDPVIQWAINAAAAGDVVLIHSGLYTEQITGKTSVNLVAVQRGSVTIRQADATVLILGGNNINFEGIIFDLNAPGAARNMVTEGGAPTARTGITFDQCEFTITTPGGFAHRVMLLQAASSVTWRRCTTNITDGANPNIQIIRNDTTAATVTLEFNNLTLNTTGGFILFSSVAGTWRGGNNRFAGTCGLFNVTLGDIILDNDAKVCTGANLGTGGTVFFNTQSGATITVAASDSLSIDAANLICDGVNDHVEIQAAIDALPATGGEVKLLDGTYNIEVALALDSYQTLRGCGRSTILTTTTIDVDIITATGGAGTEKVGITIADLCIDGDAGGVANDIGILWDYVDYSSIYNVWSLDNREHGINLNNCDWNRVENNTCQGNGTGIYLTASNNNTISGNTCQGNGAYGISLITSNNNTISGNTCQGNGTGIYLGNSNNNTISGNTCQGNTQRGFYLGTSSNNNTITGNTCQGNTFDGIYLWSSSNNIISGNTWQGNGYYGIYLDTSNNNTISGNTLTENSQQTTNIYDDIFLLNSDYNNIQGNTCRAGALANKPRYGINISNAACDGNLVTNNDLYNDGFGTGSFKDVGTGTRLNTYAVPFADGSDPQDSGFLIDAATEYARAWLRLPNKVVQVVRMKVYARSTALEADKMRAEFVIYGGADNEPYNTHNGSVANHPSTSANFAANDIIYWTITAAGVLALLGGDTVEVKVLFEDAGGADCATSAYFRAVTIEYV